MSNVEQSEKPVASTRDTWARIARRIRVPLGFGFAFVYVVLARPTKSSLAIGAMVLIPGLLLRGMASGHVQKDKELTTSGPYAYTRNPLYLGSLILAAGFAIAARNWWIVAIMLAMFTIIYVPVIASEERYLLKMFPEYEEYSRRVPRMLPRFTASQNQVQTGASYSAARYWKHREYQAAIGCAAVLAILFVKLFVKLVW